MAPLRLTWQTVAGARSSSFMVKGTVLNRAFAGRHKRFMVEEVRAYYDRAPDGSLYPDVRYRVRDAEAVSDAEIRDGKFSPVVFDSRLLEDVESWLSAT